MRNNLLDLILKREACTLDSFFSNVQDTFSLEKLLFAIILKI